MARAIVRLAAGIKSGGRHAVSPAPQGIARQTCPARGTLRGRPAFSCRKAAPEAIMTPKQGSGIGFGLILGGVVLFALAIFLTTGGRLGGTKKVASDADLPQVTSPVPPRTTGRDRDLGNVGSR
jgi:hypothetical protein